jgi:putative tricarboxylic transport membrane protein
MALVFVVAVLGLEVRPATGWEPEGNVIFLAGANPGSGWDTTARAALQAFTANKLLAHPVTVLNKPGAAGAIAVAEMVNQHKGKDNIILVSSLPLITNRVMGTSPYGFRDLTPINRLAATHYVFVVQPNSEIKDFKDLIARLRKDPKSVVIGGSTPPSDDWAAAMAVFGAAGLDTAHLKWIGYDGAQVAAAILGGHVQAAVNTVGEFAQHIDAGKVRALATTGPEREPKYGNVPTVKEEGVDMVFMNWRGFFGPPHMPKEALAYWQQKFGEMSKTDTWKELRARYNWNDAYLADGFPEFLAENTALMEKLLKGVGKK